MSRIVYLEGLVVVGNAFDDREIFNVAHEILVGGFDMGDKLRALRCIDRAVGEVGEVSEGAVEEYCRQTVGFV